MNKIEMGGASVALVSGETANIEALPSRSIALDGYVQGPSVGDQQDRWSLDHHDNCVRLYTLATCEQVRAHLCLGGPAWFEGRTIFVNDLDGDTLLSLWLVKNPMRANEDRVRTLVRAVGAVDSHGPAGNLLLSKEEQKVANQFFWGANTPVAKLRGKVREVFDSWPQLIEECLAGITALIDGTLEAARDSGSLEVEIVKEAKLNGHTFAMATCDGFGFGELYARGYDGGILFKDAANGTRTFTIAKRSDLVDIPVGPVSKEGTLLHMLNGIEPGWGGGSTIGGSPRGEAGRSSSLTPGQVWEAVRDCFGPHQAQG
jgi:hypothetical protein